MRRFIVTTIILCFGMIVMAQDYTKTEQGALHVEPVFEGKIVKDVNSTILTGKAIEKYNLTKMHTLKLTANEEQRNKIEELLLKDSEERNRYNEEVDHEVRGGHVYYSIFRIAVRSELTLPHVKVSRTRTYLCYQCKPKRTNPVQYEITLVLLEGENLTLDLLKQNFKRTK